MKKLAVIDFQQQQQQQNYDYYKARETFKLPL